MRLGLVLTLSGYSFSYEGLSRSHILIGLVRVIFHHPLDVDNGRCGFKNFMDGWLEQRGKGG